MPRWSPLAVSLVWAALSVAADNPYIPKLPPSEFPDIRPEMAKDGERKVELPVVPVPPKLPGVLDADRPVVRVAKRQLEAISEAQSRLVPDYLKTESLGAHFEAYRRLASELTSAADLAYGKPTERVPWYEHRLRLLKGFELYTWLMVWEIGDNNAIRRQKLEYDLVRQATISRLDAEIALLKLKEKIGK